MCESLMMVCPRLQHHASSIFYSYFVRSFEEDSVVDIYEHVNHEV